MADKEASLLLRIKTAGGEALDKTKEVLKGIGVIAVTAFAAVTAAVVKSIDAYKEQEDATKSLTQAMVNNGVYSRKLLDDYSAQASALQKLTTYGDEQIMAAQAAVQQQIGAHAVTKDLTKAILDFATAQKMDLVSAAEVVGKSIGTSNNALARYGIEVNTAGTQSQKTSQIIQGLSNKFGGQAEAAAKGLGAIEQLKVSVGDLFETLGERLAPVVTMFSQALNSFISDSNNTSIALDALVGVMKFLTEFATTAVFTFQSLGATIGGVFATVISAGEQLIQGEFTKAKDAVVNGMNEIGNERARIQEEYNQKIATINQAFSDQQKARDDQDVINLQTSLQKRGEVIALETQNQQIQKLTNDQTFFETRMAQSDANQQMELAKLQMDEDTKRIAILTAQEAIFKADLQMADKKLALATSTQQKLKLLQEKSNIESALAATDAAKKQMEIEKTKNDIMAQNRQDTLSRIAGMQSSSNAALAGVGKAAAMTQLAIDTPMAIGRALASAPPPFNFVLAAGVAAAMADQVSRLSGVALAEGGIVKARPGGIQATIGEGGQDEAVIPLDKAGMIGGGSVTINVYGGLLGDQSSAHDFAIAVDRELFKLRRNNESTAFDGRI